MTTIDQQDILFDDATIIEQLFGQQGLTIPSANANCDCSAYYSTENDDLVNPYQITASAAATY